MTKQQAQWAAQHDWFLQSVYVGNGEWEVITRPGHDESNTYQRFNDYQALRQWAGY